MKNNRQEKILAIIEAEPIETQEQLLSKLQEQGIESTQATISRDIKQLHLIKEPVGGGRYRSTLPADCRSSCARASSAPTARRTSSW